MYKTQTTGCLDVLVSGGGISDETPPDVVP